MTKYKWVIILIFLAFIGCESQDSSDGYVAELERVGSISFALDSLTSQFNHFQVVSDGGIDYMYMLNQFNNRFVVYDLQTQKMLKTFTFSDDPKSPISIGSNPPSGFSYISSDSIILYDYNNQNVFMGNENGEKALLVDLRKAYPTQREYWASAFQGAEPLMINDSILSITAAVIAGVDPFQEDHMSDIYVNLKTGKIWKENFYPDSYISGDFYTTERLRPTRAMDEKRKLIYYNFLNSDSIQILDLKTNKQTAFFANNINKLPEIRLKNIEDFREVMGSSDESFIYQNTQGAFFAIFYNTYMDHIIRLGFEGNSSFDVEQFKNESYNQQKILSFYDAKSHKFLGNLNIDGLGFDYMFFDKDHFYMAEISQNKSEDALVFTKFKYPDF